MDPHRTDWNEQHKLLRAALSRGDAGQAIEFFLHLHAQVHAGAMAQTGEWSLEDEVWEGVSDEAARRIPPGGEHSYAWIYWHIARIEDVTMNLLLGGGPQLFHLDGWQERLKTPLCDTGNNTDGQAVARLSAALDISALRAYRLAVGRRTRAVVGQLQPMDFRKKVDPARLQLVLAQGAVTPSAQGLIDYWGGLTIAGLLLMPPTRHNFYHQNEALRMRKKIER
jgi:hypothetical protein